MYMKKQYKSSITKNHKIKNFIFFYGFPLKVIFRFCTRNQTKHCAENQVTDDA